MIALARKTLVYEWRRFLPVVLAMCFAGVLLIVQAALVLGIFGTAAIYVKASTADIWAGFPGTQSVNYGHVIGADVENHLRMDPDVTRVEPYEWVDGEWTSTAGGTGTVSVYLSGISTHDDAMMFARVLPADLRAALREPGAVIVDSADLDTLGVDLRDGRAWINNRPVHVVAALPGLRGLGGVNVLASLDTARGVAGTDPAEGSTYFVAGLRDPARADVVRARLAAGTGRATPVQIWTADAFASRSQRYWLLDTGAGIAVLFMAIIVCFVGAVITNQSFASVVAGSVREYATLNALGAGRYALARVVVEQALLIGGVGTLLAAVLSAGVLALAAWQRVPVQLTPGVVLGCIGLVVLMALLSSIMAVRSVVRSDPSLLLR
ncbi:ABC transporter permease [Stenotrophomonas sp. 24(2023)]|uniref:ABC transporter permease n=1 Tax=Stenotrophomonas sp. 24(2023) TaxID=3068324 RepID=UPI0027DFCC15|nr:ABC transporter permease [Stenotrophomonas sp. 24(2023)]WMJ68634.1 ABC transporter permease [Stenotrophomonas sp. 24(2023)]